MSKLNDSEPARWIRIASVVALLSFFHAAAVGADGSPTAAGGDGEGWKLVSQSGGLTIYNRARKNSSIQEVKAVSIIEAAPSVLKRVIDDTDEYPRFMPYVVESKVISLKGDILIGYQRISPPIISDRDYTIRVHREVRRNADGAACFCNRWETANDLGPVEKSGIARVKVNEGYWLLEPASGGKQTLATYCVYSDSGGALPASIANAANRTAIPKLFEAVRKQAKLEKYSAAK